MRNITKILFVAAVVLLPMAIAAQDFKWSVDFGTIFDNREGEDKFEPTKTTFQTVLAPEIGIALDGKHRIMGGAVWKQPIGSEWDGYKISPTLYYRFETPALRFSFGMFPRTQLLREQPDVFWSDSLKYNQRNIRGALVQYVHSNGFFEAGLMHIMGLVIAILIFSKKDSWRAVAKLGAPAMFFNIQEPIAFGLPIVLNPLLLVPYVLVPLVNTVIGYVAISIGLVPIFKYVVPWTMPLFFGGTIGTGSIMGGLLQVVWLLVDIAIYAPFVIAGNKVKDEYDEEEA